MADHSLPERDRAAQRRPTTPESSQADADPAPHPLLALQRQVGNATISRLLAQRSAVPAEELEDPDVQRSAVPAEELEDPDVQRSAVPTEDQEDPALQLSRGPEVGPEGGPVSDATASRIESMRGAGSSLDDGARTEMESSLGDSFADVRVHTGAEAHQLNRSLGAKAFTTGSDIFFAEGASPADKGLLAHELTHVSQQRAMSASGPLTVGPADDAFEAAAENTAAAVTSGAAPAQREPDEA